MLENILAALKYIDVAMLSYLDWIRVGMALKHEGFSCSVWDEWSKNDVRYQEGECQKKWDSFHGGNPPVTGATIIQMAEARGWGSSDGTPLDWDAIITDMAKYDTDSQIPDKTCAVRELITYLKTLFDDDDFVSYVTKSWKDKSGKLLPTRGIYTRTAGELIASLQKNPDDIASTIGDWDPEAGAWIRINPLDGKGISDKNVTDFRYALIESDSLPVEEQAELYRKLKLPIATLVYSGNKSLHAIVHVDAENYDEYGKRVDILYAYLNKHNVDIDKQTRNPSRLSRLPGVTRNGKCQKLIVANIGEKSWDAWMKSIQINSNEEDSLPNKDDELPNGDDGLPPIIPLSIFLKNPPPLGEELIEGVLRRKNKCRLSGPSKAGKSFMQMQLAVALAEGRQWLGMQCKKSRVLYMNMELEDASAVDRLAKIYQALNIEPVHSDDILLWNLRGHSSSLEELLPQIVNYVKDLDVDLIIIDPLYKIFGGSDENSAAEVSKFCNSIDELIRKLNCAVLYCQHYSKGSQSGKTPMDRASGSGVFARDPDAILDVSPLSVPDDLKESHAGATAWRLEYTLRDFPEPSPVNFWFTYPIHQLDTENALKNSKLDYGARSREENKNLVAQQRKEELMKAFKACSRPVHIAEMAKRIGKCEKTVNSYLDQSADVFWHEKGIVGLVKDRDQERK